VFYTKFALQWVKVSWEKAKENYDEVNKQYAWDTKNAYKNLIRKLERTRSLRRLRPKYEDNITMGLKQIRSTYGRFRTRTSGGFLTM
jgi:phosphoenolpyruvate carboxylase